MKLSGFEKLDKWTKDNYTRNKKSLGYPGNNDSQLQGFYEWYTANDMQAVMVNNAGDPFSGGDHTTSSLDFEREVIEYFAPKYGFDKDDTWGLVTMSGTDGNSHGIYFGINCLLAKTGKMPVIYVSDEAHYSNYRICSMQHLDIRLVETDALGRMIPEALERVIDGSRPCLMIYAVGSTLKGAVDNQQELNKVLERHAGMEVYRHVDAALFGGYLPFTHFRNLVNRREMHFDSISISGHKFFGVDNPCGLFITTRKVYDGQVSYDVPYLNANMRMINCSRSGVDTLKLWWLIQTVGDKGWTEQAARVLENTVYLKSKFEALGWPCRNSKHSNTIIFKCPSDELVHRYTLACGNVDGKKVAHIVVMQHVTKELIDEFIDSLAKEAK